MTPREYQAKWRAENAERLREYRAKNREKRAAQIRAWRESNAEHVREYQRKYDRANARKKLDQEKERRRANPDKYRAIEKAWRSLNPEKVAFAAKAGKANRRARKRAGAETLRPYDVKMQLFVQKGRCFYCLSKLTSYHVDHVVPLANGGRNSRRNIVCACPGCNLRKGTRDAAEFMAFGVPA